MSTDIKGIDDEAADVVGKTSTAQRTPLDAGWWEASSSLIDNFSTSMCRGIMHDRCVW